MSTVAEDEGTLNASHQVANSVSVHFSGRTHYVAITSATAIQSAGVRTRRRFRPRSETTPTLDRSIVLLVRLQSGYCSLVRPDDRG